MDINDSVCIGGGGIVRVCEELSLREGFMEEEVTTVGRYALLGPSAAPWCEVGWDVEGGEERKVMRERESQLSCRTS